jgi:histidinol-phosphate aminotransferase
MTVSSAVQNADERYALARAAYREIPLYTPDKTPVAIDLRDNTNLWGVPPAAARVIADAARAVARYPTLYSMDLKRRIAEYVGHGVTPESIVVGCGSDEVLGSAIRGLAEPGDHFVYSDPTFPMAVLYGRMAGLTPVPIPFAADWDIDPDAISAARGRVIYVCSPNNPTGVPASRASIEAVVTNSDGLVIIDEAYAEFAGVTSVDLALENDRVLVTRTFSKAFGLAGLRVGYGIGAPALIREIEKARGPYTVNALAERAAVAALTEDLEWVRERVAETVANRVRLREKIAELGFAPLPSESNFILLVVRDAVGLTGRLFDLGVGIRPYPKLPRIGDAVRMTVGPWSMMQTLLSGLRTAHNEWL